MTQTTDKRLAPPSKYNAHRWHWIDTEHGMMAASWYPHAVDGGLWDISGHTKRPDDPSILNNWEYFSPAYPPDVLP